MRLGSLTMERLKCRAIGPFFLLLLCTSSMTIAQGISPAPSCVTLAATITTILGKSSVWQPAKHANADDCDMNSQESRFHFRTRARDSWSQSARGSPCGTMSLRNMRSQLIAPSRTLFVLFTAHAYSSDRPAVLLWPQMPKSERKSRTLIPS